MLVSTFARKVWIRASNLNRIFCGDLSAQPPVGRALPGSSSVGPGGCQLWTRLKGACSVEQ